MLQHSFLFVRGLSEDQERALWARGITTWDLVRAQYDEVVAVLGQQRAQRLAEGIVEAQGALARSDSAWFKQHWPERETWRLWQGYAQPQEIAQVDIETTGLTPGYDQVTVIGLADATGKAQACVAGIPQTGDEPLDRFRDLLRPHRLLVTFNGLAFDAPFLERHFRAVNFRLDLPHLDLLILARSLGLGGGLKDLEPQLGIVRPDDLRGVRGGDAIALWGRWKGTGDAEAYRTLVTYCKADCVNLTRIAAALYQRKRDTVFTPHARHVDFAAIKGEQLTLF